MKDNSESYYYKRARLPFRDRGQLVVQQIKIAV